MSIVKVFYRSPHNYDLDEASRDASVKDFGPSLTVQSMAEDVDINIIMKRFGVTGKMPEGIAPLEYSDFDSVVDFRSAMDVVNEASRRFGSMPADVRARFLNDPQRFMDFCHDPANVDEMLAMGLAIQRKPEVIPVVRVVSDERPTAGTKSSSTSFPAGGSSAPPAT